MIGEFAMRTWITAAALGSAVLGGFGTVAAQAQEAAREAAPPAPPPPGGPLMSADADGDGVVTREEAIAAADRRFAEMDTDHDGKIEARERRAHRDRHRPMHPGPDGDGPPPPPDRNGSAPPPPPPPPPGFDRDAPPPPDAGRHDGRRHHGRRPRLRDETQAQFRERALKLFDRADTNHDGRVDAREREAMELLIRARSIGENGDRRDAPPPPPAG